MDFFSNLIKAFIDYFSTTTGHITLIIIVLAAVITAIANHAIPAFGRFIKGCWRALPMLRWRWRRWRDWVRFRPKCCISPISKVNVEAMHGDNGIETQYRIFFQFRLQCQNKDESNRLKIDCSYGTQRMYFELRARNAHRRTKAYFLEYKDGDIKWSVPPSKTDERIYLVEGNTDTIPMLGEQVRCKVVHLAYARLGDTGGLIKPSAFYIEVQRFRASNQE